MAKQTPQFTPLPQYGPAKPSKPTSSLNMSVKPKPNANIYTSGQQQNFTPLPKPNNSNIPQMSILPGSNLPQMSVVPNSYSRTQPNVSNATIYTSGPQQNFTAVPGKTTGTSTAANTVKRVSGGSTGSNATVSGGVNKTGTGSLATPAGAAVIGSSEFDYSKTPQQIAEEEALKRSQDYNDQQSQQDLNYENIMRDTLRQFQGEIDATNQVYADKLRVAGLQGQNRLGQQRAEDFNSGAVNSSFGNAARERVQSYNTDVEGGIQAQKLQSLAQIESQARELGNKYYEQKKAAKESGLAGYLENIKSAGAQKEAIATDIATNMLNAGLTVDEISPAKLEKIAKDAGVPLQQIKTTFKAMKDAMDAAAAEAALKGQFNLSEGQGRYDVNGKLIASRAKTYAPSSGGSGLGTGDPAVDSWVNLIKSGHASITNVPAKLKSAVAVAYQNSLGGGSNGVLSDSAQSVVNLVDDLLANPHATRISGPLDQVTGGLTGKGALAKNQYKQLQGLLSLQNRTQLKGQGAISDFEFKVLQDASSAIGRNLTDKDFVSQLTKLKSNLLANGKNITPPGGTGNVVQAPDGEVIEITD